MAARAHWFEDEDDAAPEAAADPSDGEVADAESPQ